MTTPGRRRLSPEQRRSQLVDATIEVLAAVGFRSATAETIAAQAGVSKGLLWHYFDDLDDLLEQTARRTVMSLAHAVGSGLDLTAPAPQVVREALHGAARLRETHGARRSAVDEIVANLRNADGSWRFGLQDYEELYTAQEAIFRRGQEMGDFRADLDPRILAVTYQGAVDAMLGYLDSHPNRDGEAYADTVADILLGGICE